MNPASQFAYGFQVGNGAAINVELGWIPDLVIVTNLTDGDKITIGNPNKMIVPFSSGGTQEIAAGDTIIGATSGARAIVEQVLVYSGTWAGGDAAGFFVVDRDTIEGGPFGSENVGLVEDDNDAGVTANVVYSVSIDTEVASETGNAAIAAYEGVAGSNAKGFTIGSTVAEEAKLLSYAAFRN